MSIRLQCEHCGTRSLDEFVYGEIFDVPSSITDPVEANLDRGFNHNNIAGEVTEAWFHLYGCRRWITIRRDTTTNEIIS